MGFAMMTALLLSAAPVPSAVAASDAEVRSAQAVWNECVDRTKTNLEWGQCGGVYVRSADAALNAEWKRLMAAVDGQTKADLVAEQRAWLAYRRSACKFWANGEQGREGQVLHYPGCVASVIEQRTAALAEYRTSLVSE